MSLLLHTPFDLAPLAAISGNLSLSFDLLAPTNPATTLFAAEGAATLPQTLVRLSRVGAVQVLLADAPLIALGLVGFGLGTFWLLVGGMGRAELCLILSILMAFFAAVFDLSQVLIVHASNQAPAPLVLAQQTLLAFSCALRFAFVLILASRCPPREAWACELATGRARHRAEQVVERKAPQSGFDDDEDDEEHEGRQHSAAWSTWGGDALGPVFMWKAVGLVLAVATLSLVWRIGFLFFAPRFLPFYTADLIVQLALSVVLALKILTTARLSARRVREPVSRTLSDYAGVLLGLGIGVGVTSTGLAIPLFSETPVGRLLQVLDLYTLSVAQLLLFFRSRDHRSLPADVLAYLASIRPNRRAPTDGGDGPAMADWAQRAPLDVPRHPSPARRTSGGLANWLREVPHLLTAPSSSSIDSEGRHELHLQGPFVSAYDVELGQPVADFDDFRTPRSALGKDLDLPLTAGFIKRQTVGELAATSVHADRTSAGTDSLGWTGLARPSPQHLVSDGTFRPLDESLGKIHVTNAADDDDASGYSLTPTSTSATSDTGAQALLEIGQLLSRSSDSTAPSPDRDSLRLKLPRLPTASTFGVRRTRADGELFIDGKPSLSNLGALGQVSLPNYKGSGLSLPPLASVLQPPPAAAVRPTRTYTPSTATSRSTRSQSSYSQGSSITVCGPSSEARRRPPPPSLPRRLLTLSPPADSPGQRASVRASTASGLSWSTSNGIASMYLESFPAPPPPPAPLRQAMSPTPSNIGVALGGPDTDLRLSVLNDRQNRWRGASSPQRLPRPLYDSGRSLGEQKVGEPSVSLRPCNPSEHDVDVTSFIAGPRDNLRGSTTPRTPRRFRSSIDSITSAFPHSPATIHQAQLLVRKPSLKVSSTSRSTSPADSSSRAATPVVGPDVSRPTMSTVTALPAGECLQRLAQVAPRSKGTLTTVTDIPAVVLLETMMRERPAADQQWPGAAHAPSPSTSSMSASTLTVDSTPVQTPAVLSVLSAGISRATLSRSGSFKDRIAGRVKPSPSPSPLSLVSRRSTLKGQLSNPRAL